jgi:O-antigen ligase
MEISLNDIPYISLLFLAIFKYNNFTDIKEEIHDNPIKLIISLITILILSIIIEYNLGHYFILLIILMCYIILDGDNKTKQNLDDKIFSVMIFLFGVFIVTGVYVSKKDITKWLFVIIGLCILFGINYLVLVTSKLKLKVLLKNGILGALIPSLVLLWCENERKPLIKYVKLFYRKGQ